MSEKNGAASSRGMQASPAVGAKCVKSSGSSLSTERDEREIEKSVVRFDAEGERRSEICQEKKVSLNCAQQEKLPAAPCCLEMSRKLSS